LCSVPAKKKKEIIMEYIPIFKDFLEIIQQIKATTIVIEKKRTFGASSSACAFLALGADDFGINPIWLEINQIMPFIGTQFDIISDGAERIIVKSGKSKVKINTLGGSPIDIQKPNIENNVKVKIPEIINKGLSLVNQGDMRFYAQGIGYSENVMCISDGVAMIFHESQTPFSGIIPKDAAVLAGKLDSEISVGEKTACIQPREGIEIFFQMIQGDYPPIGKVINQSTNLAVSVSSKELREAVNLAMNFSDKNRVLNLSFEEEVLTIIVRVPGKSDFESKIQCSNVDDKFVVNFHADRLQKLAAMTDEVDFNFESAGRPCKICDFGIIVPARF
jgi:hypothetical protein